VKNKLNICLIILLIATIFSCDTDSNTVKTPEFDDDIILHTKWSFPVGVAVPGARTNNAGMSSSQANALNSGNPQNKLLKHFNVVVAENEMKPENLMPGSKPSGNSWKDSYTWGNADALVNFAEENGKKIRGHTLFWEDQTPSWFFPSTAAELYDNMENHAKAVFEKYGGRIEWWDVCNEVIDQSEDGPRRGRYYDIMKAANKIGMEQYEYVLKAFEYARYYADLNDGQNVKLYLTDFGVERPFTKKNNTKQQDFYDLVEWLIQNDAPIDGVGFQGHFRLYDHPVDKNKCLSCTDKSKCNHDISSGIDLFSAIKKKDDTNIMVQICELDISIFSNAKGEASNTSVSNSVLSERLTDLAQTYRDFFDMFKVKYSEGKLNMVVLWGIADGHSWLNDHPVQGRTDHPLLFNRNYKGKEAYSKLIN